MGKVQIQKLKATFADDRGAIYDIFNGEGIRHVGHVTSKKDSVRGNHYHKKELEYMYIVRGKFKLLAKDVSRDNAEIEEHVVVPGDIIINPPNTAHTLVALEDSEFFHITNTVRGEDTKADSYPYRLV